MGDNNKAYRRVLIIDTTEDEILIDECLVGPLKSENHLRELFANRSELKGVPGDDIFVKTYEVAQFESSYEKPKKTKKKKK